MNRSALFVVLAIALTLSQETSQAFFRPSQTLGPSAGGLGIGIAAATGIVLSAQTAIPVHAGAVEHIKVHGKSLEGNLEGDSPDRDVSVYLPPSYRTERVRRYPVVYLLHGGGGTDRTWLGGRANVPESVDKLVAAGRLRGMIIVIPAAYTLQPGNMYSNPVTIGDWERHIAHGLSADHDAHYRKNPDPASRGLAGVSRGGYGAIRIAMKRADVFSSLYILSACCLTAEISPDPAIMAAAGEVRTREAAQATEPGGSTNLVLMHAAAWSPNPTRPPLFLDLPIEDGKGRPDIVAKWTANAVPRDARPIRPLPDLSRDCYGHRQPRRSARIEPGAAPSDDAPRNRARVRGVRRRSQQQ